MISNPIGFSLVSVILLHSVGPSLRALGVLLCTIVLAVFLWRGWSKARERWCLILM